MAKIQKILHRTKYIDPWKWDLSTCHKAENGYLYQKGSYSIPCMLVYIISLVTLDNQILTKHKYGFTAVFTPDFFLH